MATNAEIGQRIKERREALGLTLAAVADPIGLARSTVNRYETGKIERIKMPVIEAIASALHVNPAWLVFKSDDMLPPVPQNGWIPVRGNVAAGIPLEAVEDVQDYEEIDPALAATGEYAALRIKGQSMEPRIMDGDVVIVHLQETVESGDVAVVFVNGDEATVKRVKLHDNGLSLIPFNPSFEVRFFTAEEVENLPVRIWGKVVELRGKL